jgi:DNA-binding transcriptional regulator YbjK
MSRKIVLAATVAALALASTSARAEETIAVIVKSLPGTRGKTPGNRNQLICLCFLNIAVDSIPGRTQVLRQVAQQPRARLQSWARGFSYEDHSTIGKLVAT